MKRILSRLLLLGFLLFAEAGSAQSSPPFVLHLHPLSFCSRKECRNNVSAHRRNRIRLKSQSSNRSNTGSSRNRIKKVARPKHSNILKKQTPGNKASF